MAPNDAPKHNVLNIKKMIRERADHRVSQQYINEVADILEGVLWQMVNWSDNAAEATGNGTLLISHVPYFLIDRHDAIDRAIEKHYERVDVKEERRREREAKKSSQKFHELIDADDKLKKTAEMNQ